MRIVFSPISNKKNEYINLIVNYLRKNDVIIYESIFRGFKTFFTTKIIHLNWYENVYSKRDYFLKILRIYIFKISNKKIVYTFHNKSPHLGDFKLLEKKLIKFLLKKSDKIVIHSKVSESIICAYDSSYIEKTVYIPHPNYIGVYGNKKANNNIRKSSDKLHLLFFGLIKRYKNIELLIELARKNNFIEITIAGKPNLIEYENEILEKARDISNLNLSLRFQSNNDLVDKISSCDLVILPYNLESSLNSGTVILAMSYGKSVICPNIGTIQEVKNKDSVFTYSYGSEKEHFKKLNDCVQQAYEIKLNQKNLLERMGNVLFDEVKNENDINKVGGALLNLYKDII